MPKKAREASAEAALSYLGKTVTVTVDRPLGSRHPDHGFVYPINYGFMKGTIGGDDEELDAYILGVARPVKEFTGRCVAVILRRDDIEDKLIVAASESRFSADEVRELTAFQESAFRIEIRCAEREAGTPT